MCYNQAIVQGGFSLKYTNAVLVVLSDMQIGSTVALAPKAWNLIEGGTYQPSKIQKLIRKYIEKDIQLIKQIRQGKRLIFVLNGEPIDGVHHGTNQLITQNKDEQIEMAVTVIDEFLTELEFDKEKGDCLFFIEGTEAHDGAQHSNIEKVARDFQDIATPYRADKYGRDGRMVHPYKNLIINGVQYRIQHHGAGIGSRFHTKTNSLAAYIKSVFQTCVAYGEEPPDWLIQSHLHRYTRATHYGISNGKRKKIEGVITPSCQVATSFVKKISPNDLSDIGIYFQEIDEHGNVTEHDEGIYRAPEDKYERV
jgi:hypothetical protein